ncbi:hypothetical protein HHX47_DHR6000642 [Lentinula edodes]|nr:hypothetical protein HHX47_DHR6000642 [Lentinula edodes]
MVKRLLHSDTSLGSHTTRTRQSKLIGYNKLTPERRDGVNASCEPDYNWANNDAGISPCVMAAAIEACETGPATQWTNGVFNVTQAQAVVNGTLSLQTSATSQSTSSKPIAAIIGASVGGTVVLLCFTGILFWVRRRNASKDEGRYQNLPNVGTPPSTRLSSSTPHSTINTRNDSSLRNSLYPSSISDYTGSLIHSEDSTRNSGVLTPFRKSYIDYPTAHDDGIYARPEDLAPIRRNTGPSVAPRSTQQMYDIIRNHQLGRYSEPVLPGSSGSGPAIYTYTILANNVAEETEEVPTDSSSPSARRTSNPPPYSPGGPSGEL